MNAITPTPAARSWQEFQNELQKRTEELGKLLPRHISRDRFLNSAIAAVKQTPDLLSATPRTLFAAIAKSAQDGLLPDGREGVISVYNVKIKGTNGAKETWEKHAQWNPMVFGLRKRAWELDSLTVDAQAVYANDEFLWRQGDDPGIDHVPAPMGTPRGQLIGAYAIFRSKDRAILHREVMDRTQIEAVRAQSKAPDSLMWTKFEAEGYKKTVVRRGFKTVPASEPLEQLVTRDDEQFTFSNGGHETPSLTPPPPPPARERLTPPPPPGKQAPQGDVIDGEVVTDKPGEAEGKALPQNPGTANPEEYLKFVKALFDTARTVDELNDLFNTHIADDLKKLFPPDAAAIKELYRLSVKGIEGDA